MRHGELGSVGGWVPSSPLLSCSHLPLHLGCTWSLKLSRCEIHTEHSCWVPTALLRTGSCAVELLAAASSNRLSCRWGCSSMLRGGAAAPCCAVGLQLHAARCSAAILKPGSHERGRVQDFGKAPPESLASSTAPVPNVFHSAVITE